MNYYTFDISKNDLEVAYNKLSIQPFPDWSHVPQLIHQMDPNDNTFLFSMIEWLKLLDKKYLELTTALVYSQAYLDYLYENDLFGKNDKNDFYYVPELAFFTDSASSKMFSLSEKFAQLLNVYLQLGLHENSQKGRPYVSFDYIYKNVDAQITTILDPLKVSLEKLNETRNRHIHRYSPENIRWKTTPTNGEIIKQNDERIPTTFLITEIDNTVLPITPHEQINYIKEAQIEFQKVIKELLKIIVQNLIK